ncbi:MAG: hypothetical protein COV75_01970 [Candidatus Omnitrophica bacterium CG11_big_fil_rev_8_21_14_0_20_63_9]|nr:MAG: hypothetical protein COV75_01970 [Candidatus Omnitrophica bacterium CG11_big_fil_rev_8_21_14_0_20_63_9]
MMRQRFLWWTVAAVWFGAMPASAAPKPLKVVATLSTFADLAKTIGGDHVDVSSIAPPQFNPHFIEPKPSDVLKVKRAQLLIHAGLDLELWRGPLLDAAGNTSVFPGQPGELDLSRGIELLEVPDRPMSRAEGDIHLYGNPHYWLSPDNGRTMAKAICDKLCEIDPHHQDAYHRNLETFLAELAARVPEWRAHLALFRGQELVGYHNEWPYLMGFAGLRMEHFLEPKPGIPPTPKQVEFLTQHIGQHHIRAIVQSSSSPRQAADTLAKRSGARVAVLCQSVRELPSCGDYMAMLEYNVQQLMGALRDG